MYGNIARGILIIIEQDALRKREKQEWPFAEVSESVLYLDLSQDADVEPRPARGSGDVEMQRDGCKTAVSSTPNSIDCEHGSSPRAWLAHARSAVMDAMAEERAAGVVWRRVAAGTFQGTLAFSAVQLYD